MLSTRYGDQLATILIPRDHWHPFPAAAERESWEAIRPAVREAHIARGEQHLGFVRGLIDEKRLLAAGRRDPPDGSVLLFAGDDAQDSLALLAEDPYALAGVVEYEAVAVFAPGAVAEGLDALQG